MSRLYLKAFLTLTLTFPFFATSASPQQEQRPQFRTEVEAVLVDVVVLDDDGRPVMDLTIEDFEIYEDGFPQTIQSFDVVDWSAYVAKVAPREPEEIEKVEPTPPPAPVATFPRRFIFIINRQGAKFDFLIRAKEAIESFIVESMAEDDEAMVIDMAQSTRIVQQFSSSKETVLQSVKKIPPMRADIFYGTRMATENVYDGLWGLAEGLSPIPGRKVIIFMSPELIKSRDLRTELREAVASLNTSNTTIYAVNIEGVETIARTDEDRMDAVSDPEETSIVADTSAPESELDSLDVGGLFSLAHETGGRYFINMNVFEPAVQRIGEENQRYYLLTYMPTNRVVDKRYRRIEVKVNRPDVRVNARRGYFARGAGESTETDPDRSTMDVTPAPEPEAEAPSEDAAPPTPAVSFIPRPPTQVEITNYLMPAPNGKVEVPIAVALPRILVSDDTGQSVSRILGMTLIGASGAALAKFSDAVNAEDFSAVRTAVLAPGLYRLDITLTEGGEMVYETSTQIDVPVGYGQRFGLSSIIPFPQSRDPEIDKKARPTSTLIVGQDVLLNFRVFPGKKDQPSESADLVFSIFQDDREIQSMRYPQKLDLTKGQDIGLQVMTSLPMSRFGPGDYRLVVWVSDSVLGRRATGELLLTVVP